MEAGSPRKHFHPASKLHSILWPISLLGKNRSGTAAKLPSTKAPTEVEKPKEREAEQAAADFPLTFLQSSLQNTFYGRSPTWTCERNPEQSSGLRQRLLQFGSVCAGQFWVHAGLLSTRLSWRSPSSSATHCCRRGWRPAAAPLCVCTSAGREPAAGLEACRGE